MNRLAKESSPYLQQHGNNPVDWYPWGEEALARAKKEDKPIHLSVGYSACHWCHVMAHECFENPEIAKLMNENFINIKVDREERPDLDHIYQNVAQAMTHSGGWPLTVFLTPDLKPFFGGTYFPPDDRYGRPGFPRLLTALSNAYKNDRESIAENSKRLLEYISSAEEIPKGNGVFPDRDLLIEAAELILSRCDWAEGGLGGAPKFPNTMIFSFLWRLGNAAQHDSAKQAVLLALTKMASGGIYDQIGGGFHRYSVDDTWSVPHFEKMLYDNGLLLKLYSEVLLSEGGTPPQRELFLKVIEETTDYLLREMRAHEGGFYSAQDADSEGEEGKFFVWDRKDAIEEGELTPEEAKVFADTFGITAGSNFEHGKTVLYLAQPLEKIDWKNRDLKSARQKIFAARAKRIAPSRDDKILASWNALAISGLAWASQALRKLGKITEADRVWSAANQAHDFVIAKMSRDGDRLWSVYQNGAKLNAYLDDYAFMALAALDLARFEKENEKVSKLSDRARSWNDVVWKHFVDEKNLGFYFTSDDHEELIQRPKTFYDQAIPAGIAAVLTVSVSLSEIDPERSADCESKSDLQIRNIFSTILGSPFGFGELLSLSLLRVMGPLAVSGKSIESKIQHPHIFRKSFHEDQLMTCHRKSCHLTADFSPFLKL